MATKINKRRNPRKRRSVGNHPPKPKSTQILLEHDEEHLFIEIPPKKWALKSGAFAAFGLLAFTGSVGLTILLALQSPEQLQRYDTLAAFIIFAGFGAWAMWTNYRIAWKKTTITCRDKSLFIQHGASPRFERNEFQFHNITDLCIVNERGHPTGIISALEFQLDDGVWSCGKGLETDELNWIKWHIDRRINDAQ